MILRYDINFQFQRTDSYNCYICYKWDKDVDSRFFQISQSASSNESLKTKVFKYSKRPNSILRRNTMFHALEWFHMLISTTHKVGFVNRESRFLFVEQRKNETENSTEKSKVTKNYNVKNKPENHFDRTTRTSLRIIFLILIESTVFIVIVAKDVAKITNVTRYTVHFE